MKWGTYDELWGYITCGAFAERGEVRDGIHGTGEGMPCVLRSADRWGEEEKEDVRKGRAGSGADGTDGYGFQVSISLGGCSNYWPNSITHS